MPPLGGLPLVSGVLPVRGSAFGALRRLRCEGVAWTVSDACARSKRKENSVEGMHIG